MTKKALIFLLFFMLMGMVSSSVMAEEAFFSHDGYSVYLTGYEILRFKNTNADMYLYARIINDTDRELSLLFKDLTVDGVGVLGTGFLSSKPHSDTGINENHEDDASALIITSSDNAQAGTAALSSARRLDVTLVLKDKDSEEELYREKTSVDLKELEGGRHIEEPETEPVTEPAPVYHVLRQGDKGEDVKKLQEKLIALGYLADKADGSYGPKTAAAVKELNEQNGLGSSPEADAITQDMIFSGLANPRKEPEIPLVIGSSFKWDGVPSVNTFFFRVQVTNTSSTRTIRGYELSLYTTDVWGERVADTPVYTSTKTQTVRPGETVYCDSFNLGYLASVYTVWVGVSRIVFDDGEVRDVKNIDYYSCVIK